MLRFWADWFAVLIQDFVLSTLVCRLYKVKEPYGRSFIFAYLQQIVAYVLVNFFFSETPMQRITMGTLAFIVVGFSFFEGSIIKKICNAISEYALFLALDLVMQLLLFPAYIEVISVLPPLDQKLIGRNLASATLFLVYLLVELFFCRKERKYKRPIMVFSVGLGIVQLVILQVLSVSNPEGMLENRIPITVIFSSIIMGGYLVVMEVFRQTLNQQKRQAELEQMALEKQYQYDYYKKAYEQGEQLRDLRHDMRNQLQAVTLLLCSEDETSRKRAKEMLDNMDRRLENH